MHIVFFLAGERLVQQNNQPTFFSPRAGVTKVIVNQSVDHIGLQKVVEMFIWPLNIFSCCRFYSVFQIFKISVLDLYYYYY
jgi:hypothetical protein